MISDPPPPPSTLNRPLEAIGLCVLPLSLAGILHNSQLSALPVLQELHLNEPHSKARGGDSLACSSREPLCSTLHFYRARLQRRLFDGSS